MHVKVNPLILRRVRVVLLRDQEEEGRKLGVAVERSNALKDVTEEDLEGFPSDNDLLTLKPWTTTRKLLVDDVVELPGRPEAKLQKLCDLHAAYYG